VNLGDYRRPGTQTHKLLRLLLDMKRHGPMEIVREVGTRAASTVVAELRQGLDLFDSPYMLPPVQTDRAGDGTLLHFYQLALRRTVDLELFGSETQTGPQATVDDGTIAMRA
jgi:hypothetical protein